MYQQQLKKNKQMAKMKDKSKSNSHNLRTPSVTHKQYAETLQNILGEKSHRVRNKNFNPNLSKSMKTNQPIISK